MNLVPHEIIQEVVCSTKNAWKNGDFYEIGLPVCIDFGRIERTVKMGFKNIKFPQKKPGNVKTKIVAAHVLEKVDMEKAMEFELSFRDFPDLCSQMESIAYDSLGKK